MTRLGAATALCEALPREAMEQLLTILADKSTVHVDMEFQDGRCMEMKVTTAQRFQKKDFHSSSVDNVGDRG